MRTEVPFVLVSVNVSERKGTVKRPVDSAVLVAGHGIEGDAHAGPRHRQVSLLADEDIDTMRGVDLAALPVGTRLAIGEAELEVTQIGKECRADCVMPRRGIFARVLRGGRIDHDSRCAYRL